MPSWCIFTNCQNTNANTKNKVNVETGGRILNYLGVLWHEGHRSGDEEGVVAAGGGLVEAALFAQIGAEDLQGAERCQGLEMRVLLRVICEPKTP